MGDRECSPKASLVRALLIRAQRVSRFSSLPEIFDFAGKARFVYPFNYGDILDCEQSAESANKLKLDRA